MSHGQPALLARKWLPAITEAVAKFGITERQNQLQADDTHNSWNQNSAESFILDNPATTVMEANFSPQLRRETKVRNMLQSDQQPFSSNGSFADIEQQSADYDMNIKLCETADSTVLPDHFNSSSTSVNHFTSSTANHFISNAATANHFASSSAIVDHFSSSSASADHFTSTSVHFLPQSSAATNADIVDTLPVRIFPSPILSTHHDISYCNIPATTAATDGTLLEEKTTLLDQRYRGELSVLERYRYDLSRAQLKASSRTSALLAGFAMVALVELQYERSTPPYLLITLGVVTTLLVSVHLLALMMSTCILPYIEANGCTQDSPHIRLKFYIDLSWLFSTCIGLMLFLIEIGVIFFVKFLAVNYITAAYITTAMLVPVVIIFTIFSCLIHKNRFIHSMNRVGTKVNDLQKFLNENDPAVANIPNATSVQRHLVGAGLQAVKVINH